MKEKIADIGSCLSALALSMGALAVVAELSMREIPSYGEMQM